MNMFWVKRLSKARLVELIERMAEERAELRRVFDILQAESISREEEE